MSQARDELHQITDTLPEDKVKKLLRTARLLAAPAHTASSTWPPAFFGIGSSKDGKTDHGRNVDDYLAKGFGRS